MPISRDPRAERRRRVLMDTTDDSDTGQTRSRRRVSRGAMDSENETGQPKRGAGYSQDVRRACGQRLVQLIPVRRRSFLAVIFVSMMIPAFLLTAHYMIYVSGTLPWYGQPLAVPWDATHPNSIASWFSSHIWLLCLGATILTFQLRRHKLDDYAGEYRLWFWLVVTCLAASIDATTHLSELFGLALDHWAQLNIGWSGPAVVKTIVAVLIGMLGLRLCTELKAVPVSLIFWLVGLVAWAGSAALGQEELRLDDISVQLRFWLRAALWLGGLTAVWLAALSYLRHVYIEAQRRFLARGRLANQGVPIGQRIRENMPSMPAMPRFGRRTGEAGDEADAGEATSRWRMRSFRRNTAAGLDGVDADDEAQRGESARERRRREKQEAAELRSMEREAAREQRQQAGVAHASDADNADETANQRGLGGFFRRKQVNETNDERSENESRSTRNRSSRLTGWLRKPKDSDEPEEYRKVRSQSESHGEQSRRERAAGEDDEGEERPRKSWMPRLSRPKLPAMPKIPRPKFSRPKISKPNVSGWFSRFKLPSLRLPPPDVDSGGIRAVAANDELPGTDSADDSDNARPMTKAERKRLRRLQNQNRAA